MHFFSKSRCRKKLEKEGGKLFAFHNMEKLRNAAFPPWNFRLSTKESDNNGLVFSHKKFINMVSVAASSVAASRQVWTRVPTDVY